MQIINTNIKEKFRDLVGDGDLRKFVLTTIFASNLQYGLILMQVFRNYVKIWMKLQTFS